MHLTLCFLGSTPVEEIDAIAAACSAASGPAPRGLALGGVLWLPRRRPRVVAVEIPDARGELADLQARLARELQRGGWYEPEERSFNAHVTVARVARGERLRAIELAPPEPAPLDRAPVKLYRSRIGPGGARYEALSG
jgi:2'-5' RNA ligase